MVCSYALCFVDVYDVGSFAEKVILVTVCDSDISYISEG